MADSAVGVTRGADARAATPPCCLPPSAKRPPGISKLAYEYGALIGRELRDQGYNMSLGGGVDMTREPRNGRNFEYQGEDPILAGKMVGAVHERRCRTSSIIGDIKHYAFNDQETGRNIGNVQSRQARHARDRSAGVRDRP